MASRSQRHTLGMWTNTEKIDFLLESAQPFSGNTIEIQLERTFFLHMAEVEVWSTFQFPEALPTTPLLEIARRGKATQFCDSDETAHLDDFTWNAIDNNQDTISVTCQQKNPW